MPPIDDYHDVDCRYNGDRDEVLTRLGKGWHPVPNIFAILHEDEEKVGPEDDARRVPASFHKFLHILWREIWFDRGDDKPWWYAQFYMDKFNMRPSDASKWAWALHESGLFDVGQQRDKNPEAKEPLTSFRYNTKSTGDHWRAFYKALRAACAECPRPFKVGSWRAIVRRHIKANHAGVTDANTRA